MSSPRIPAIDPGRPGAARRNHRATLWWPVSSQAGPAEHSAGKGYAALSGDAVLEPIRLGMIEILPGARTVLLSGNSIDLGSRAFDLLMVLIGARGAIVSKETIISRVWPTTTVVEGNLKVQLSILRRALGAERWRIKTVSGRGYLLVLDETSADDGIATQSAPLVIELDGDPAAQRRVMLALSDIATTFEGIARLSVISGNVTRCLVAR